MFLLFSLFFYHIKRENRLAMFILNNKYGKISVRGVMDDSF